MMFDIMERKNKISNTITDIIKDLLLIVFKIQKIILV